MSKKDEEKYKRHVKAERERNRVKDEEDVEVYVVRKLDERDTFMPATKESAPNLARDIFKGFIRGAYGKQGVYDRLLRMGVDASTTPNKLWLKKVNYAYFYGEDFAKLRNLIDSL